MMQRTDSQTNYGAVFRFQFSRHIGRTIEQAQVRNCFGSIQTIDEFKQLQLSAGHGQVVDHETDSNQIVTFILMRIETY